MAPVQDLTASDALLADELGAREQSQEGAALGFAEAFGRTWTLLALSAVACLAVRAFATDAMYTIGVWKTAASWIVVLGLIGAVAVKQLPGLPLPAQTIATALACLVIGTGTLHVGEEFAVVRANQALHDELHAEAAILRAAVEDKLHGSARLEGLKVVSAMTNQTDWVLDTRKTTWDLRDARALVRTVYVGQIPGCLVRLRKQLVFEGAKLVCR